MTQPQPTVSIIIVTYNSAKELRLTLESVFQQTYSAIEAILVENCSKDDSLAVAQEFLPKGLKVFQPKENLGFCGGNNLGVEKSTGEFVFLLNPDAVLEPDTIEKAVEAMKSHQQIDVMGFKLVDGDGVRIFQAGGDLKKSGHAISLCRDEKDEGQHDEPRETVYVCGAAMLIRRPVWEALQGFDEDFFPAYYEDVDLCLRAKEKGFGVWYYPLKIVHFEGVSVGHESWAYRRLMQEKRLMTVAKHWSLSQLFFEFLPREIKWLFSEQSRTFRRYSLAFYPKMIRYYFRRR